MTTLKVDICPFCGHERTHLGTETSKNTPCKDYECDSCGKYRLSNIAEESIGILVESPKSHTKLKKTIGYIYQQHINGDVNPYICVDILLDYTKGC